MTNPETSGWLHRLRERGVIRVAASYAVIAWLLLQIADVTFAPLGAPKWAMPSLIVAAVLGFPVAVALAWFYEAGERDSAGHGGRGGSPACHAWPAPLRRSSDHRTCSSSRLRFCWCGNRISAVPAQRIRPSRCCRSRT